MKKYVFTLGLAFSLALTPVKTEAQGIFQKVVGKIAKVSGKAMGGAMGMFGSVDNLDTTAPLIIYRTHVYPKKVGAMEVDFFGKGWQDGQDGLMIQIVDKRGIKMSKLNEGSVTVDGQQAIFQDLGVYTLFMERSENSHVVELTAKNGQKSIFTITPQKFQTRILSINGQSAAEVAIDFTKEIVLELENAGPADGALIQVSFSAPIMGLNTFYEIGNFKPSDKIIIPAEAISNAGFPSIKEDGPNVKPTYIQVARISRDKPTNVSGVFKDLTYINAACDGRFVKVISKPKLTGGIVSKGETGANKDIAFEFRKDEADLSRPFAQASVIAIAGIGTRGIDNAEEHDSGRLSGIKSDEWVTFTPSDEMLDHLNEKMNTQVIRMLSDLFGSRVIPIEKVVATTAYKESDFLAEADGGSKETFARAYRSDKIISDAALQLNGFRRVPDAKSIAQEAQANALLRCVMDLSLSLENGTTYLTPIISFSLYGDYNGPAGITPTKFAEGTVSAKRFKIKEGTDVLKEINLDAMLAVLEDALKDLREKEKDAPYAMIWGMQ